MQACHYNTRFLVDLSFYSRVQILGMFPSVFLQLCPISQGEPRLVFRGRTVSCAGHRELGETHHWQ